VSSVNLDHAPILATHHLLVNSYQNCGFWIFQDNERVESCFYIFIVDCGSSIAVCPSDKIQNHEKGIINEG
jgi:hypothetical protein